MSGCHVGLFVLQPTLLMSQLCGVALATAGFAIATATFEIPYQQVLFSHGTIGVVLLVFVYSQVGPESCNSIHHQKQVFSKNKPSRYMYAGIVLDGHGLKMLLSANCS